MSAEQGWNVKKLPWEFQLFSYCRVSFIWACHATISFTTMKMRGGGVMYTTDLRNVHCTMGLKIDIFISIFQESKSIFGSYDYEKRSCVPRLMFGISWMNRAVKAQLLCRNVVSYSTSRYTKRESPTLQSWDPSCNSSNILFPSPPTFINWISQTKRSCWK